MPISKDLEAKTPRADLSAVSLIALNPSEVCQMLIDDAPLPGENRYYLRVEQNDGSMAWSSPVWIKAPQ